MSQQHDGSEWKTTARGESAWREATDRVASRNREARKAGKGRRDAYLSEREAARRAAEARRQDEVLRRGAR